MILLWRAFWKTHFLPPAPSAFASVVVPSEPLVVRSIRALSAACVNPNSSAHSWHWVPDVLEVSGFSYQTQVKEWRENRTVTGKWWLLAWLSSLALFCWTRRNFTTGSNPGFALLAAKMSHFPPGGQPSISVIPTNYHFLSSFFLIFSFLNYLWEAPTGSI